jgi:hypothetical protein
VFLLWPFDPHFSTEYGLLKEHCEREFKRHGFCLCGGAPCNHSSQEVET